VKAVTAVMDRPGVRLASLFLGLALFVAPSARADVSLFATELNVVAATDGIGHWRDVFGAQRSSIGFESFGKRSGGRGDFLTWDLQIRLSHDSDESVGEAWGLEIHNAWLEYKLELGRNLRFGHFSPAFGLEPSVDTHGTLFQTLAARDIGFKKDWGVAYLSGLGPFDTRVALQNGSGAPLDRRDGNHLATVRLGTPLGRSSRAAVSLLAGRVLDARGARTWPSPDNPEAVSKFRVGADAEHMAGPFRLSGEVTIGRDGSHDIVGALLWTDVTLPALRNVTVEAQGRLWSNDALRSGSRWTSVTLGASYRVATHWTLRGLLDHEIEAPRRGDDRIALQLYYYGG